MMSMDLQTGAALIGALEDDIRRRLYLFIKGEGRPVSREEAAEEAGISRKLAAFHLDKLVGRGLLKAHYARRPGRSGPGAGRSSKLYEASGAEIHISLPARRYDLMGSILVDAIESQSFDESAAEASRRSARNAGFAVGDRAREERGLRRPGPERALTAAEMVLSDYGFEPYRRKNDQLALRNCPFSLLAQRAPGLVCGLNQAFIEGLLRGLGSGTVEARLQPSQGQCCVLLGAAGKR